MNPLSSLKRMAPAILVSLVIIYQSLTKGWFVLWAVPTLLLAIPILLVAQSRVTKILSQSAATRTIRWAQLAGVLATYVCLPGVGDTNEYAMFGFLSVRSDTVLVHAMWICTLIAGVVAILSTIACFSVSTLAHRQQ